MQLSLKILPVVTGCIVSASITCNSQINLSYDYDASGNRISRTVTVAPSKPMQNKEQKSSEMLNEIKVTCSPNPTDGIINISIVGILEEGGFARDYLGSVISVVDADMTLKNPLMANGYLQLPVSYDPWGRLRNPETLVLYDIEKAPVLALGRGFTGHEHLPMFGLINMNARLYDPLTGRFLSPDPYVQQSESPQNYNRYSYCLNNPLRYTDKTGELFLTDDYVIGFLRGLFKGDNPFSLGWKSMENSYYIWKGLLSTDANKSFFGKIWELTSRFTWQMPQTFFGFLAAQGYNTFRSMDDVTFKYGVTVVRTPNIPSAVTIGNYIIGKSSMEVKAEDSLFQHEYGHYLQSQTFGLAYL